MKWEENSLDILRSTRLAACWTGSESLRWDLRFEIWVESGVAREAVKQRLALVFKDCQHAAVHSVGGELLKQTDGAS